MCNFKYSSAKSSNIIRNINLYVVNLTCCYFITFFSYIILFVCLSLKLFKEKHVCFGKKFYMGYYFLIDIILLQILLAVHCLHFYFKVNFNHMRIIIKINFLCTISIKNTKNFMQLFSEINVLINIFKIF